MMSNDKSFNPFEMARQQFDKIADLVELNQGQMVLEVQRIVSGKTRVESLTRYDGELITPEEIVSYLAEEE